MGRGCRFASIIAVSSTFAAVSYAPLSARAADAEKKSDANEITAVPFVGGDSDMGWGGGVLGSWARTSPKREPYLFRLEAAGVATARDGPNGFEVPYTDAYLLFETPHALPNRLKFRFRLSYTRELRLRYYGVGNASVAELEPREWAQYARTHPTLDLQAEYRITRVLRFLWGVNYTHNWLVVPEGTRLARDMQSGSPQVQQLLGEASDHAVALFSYGLALDTRNDTVNPSQGFALTGRADLSPGGSRWMPHRYARLNASFKGFVPVLPDHRLTLAGRIVGDFLTDGAPFYELGRYDSTSAIGGVQGVRGIPAQRYIGRIKVFGNIELRSEIFDVNIFKKKTRFGLTGFVDAGRVWSDHTGAHPELDGTSLGLKVGVGGGLRVVSGKSFVLRLDVAWSRDARPLGAYLTSGHAF